MSVLMQHQMVEIRSDLNAVRDLLARIETRQASLLQYLAQEQWQPAEALFMAAQRAAQAHLAPVRRGRLGDDYVASLIRMGAPFP